MGIISQFVAIWVHFLKETTRVKGAVPLSGYGKAGGEKKEQVFGPGAGHIE